MAHTWSVRAYQKGDENGIYKLEKQIDTMYPGRNYNYNDWKKWWEWKYLENPVNENNPKIWVAEFKDQIIGCNAFLPIKMKIKSEKIIVTQNVDLMVHPDFRRQGIYQNLAKEALADLKQKKSYIIYGFPNRFSYYGNIKYGWFDISPLNIGIKPLKIDRFIEKNLSNSFLIKKSLLKKIYVNLIKRIITTIFKEKKIKNSKNISASQVLSFDDEINDFWYKISDDYNIIVVRDKDYLNWRYVNVPDKKYIIFLAKENDEICGYIIIRCESQEIKDKYGSIYDIVTLKNRSDIVYSLLGKAIEYFVSEDADFIHCSMIANEKFIKNFKIRVLFSHSFFYVNQKLI